MKTAKEILEKHCPFKNVSGNTEYFTKEVLDAMNEFALQFEDDNGRAKYYEDKIDMLNRIITENKTLFTEDELRKAWNYEPKNNYEWQKFIKGTKKLPKWRTCENCDCGEFPKSICDCSCHNEATS